MTEQIPGPPGLPILGNVLDIDPVNAVISLGRLAEQYGPIFKLTVGGSAKIFISSRDLVDEVSDESRFTKQVGGPLLQLRNICADSLFTAHSDEPNWWLAHRVLMPAFGPLAIRGMFDEMHDLASQLVVKWARFGEKEVIDVSSDFTRLTLDTIALCSMSTRFNSFYHDQMHPFVGSMISVLQESGKRAVRPPFVNNHIMRGSLRQYRSDIETLRQIASGILAERRANPLEKKKDLLNVMINGRDPETGQGLSDESILNNMIVFLIAGHETTSGLLSFLFYYLLTRPDVFAKARQEVDEVVGRGPVTIEHMSKLHYLEACLRETLRLHPTAPVITFQTRPDFEKDSTTIGNGAYQILKGQSIVALLVQMQRDPSVWGSDADEFRPERMMDEHFYKLPKNSWKPFGNGIRGCIGRAFAWQESLLITAMLLQNFDFRLHDPEYKLEIKQTLTIKPGNFYMHASLREHLDPLQLERALHSVGGNATPQTQNPSRGSPSVSSGRSSLTANEEQRSMSILYGSDSGTCESMAQSLAQAATARGYAASVRPLNSAVGKLPSDQPVILISSSYNGQPPSNAVNMVKWLDNQQGNTKILQGVRYAVYGCGNKDYAATFHRIPKLLDSEFERLGAQKLAPTGLGDVTVGDVFNDFEKWQDEHLWPALGSSGPLEDYVDHGLAIEIDCSGRRKALQFDADEAVILKNEVLTAPGEPEKRYLTLKLPEGLEYRTGDHLAVLPMNDWSIVHRALKWAGLPWDAVLTIASGANTALPTGRPISAKDLLSGYVELSQPATRKNIAKLVSTASDEATREKLRAIEEDCDSGSPLRTWKRSVLDILEEFPSIQLSFAQFVAMLPPMRPRQYSIASTPMANPSIATLLWSVVLTSERLPGSSRQFRGVASTYLAGLVAGDRVYIKVKPALRLFHPPSDVETSPIIMVCAGSGLAPFRAFVQERAMQAQAGRKLAPAHLFIGCRHPEKDAVLREEFCQWEEAGVVKVHYAFSRASDKSNGCAHVQDRLWSERALISKSLFEDNYRFFVCGGAEVGRGVEDVFKRIYRESHGVDKQKEAENWFQELKSSRYITEVFS